MHRPNRFLITLCAICLAAQLIPTFDNATALGYLRIEGQDRYHTASEMAVKAYPFLSDAVIVASGQNYADSLAGAALSYRLRSPLVLVKKFDDFSGQQRLIREIQNRWKPFRIIFLGGPNAIDESTVDRARTFFQGEIVRLWGATRVETSIAIAKYGWPDGFDEAYITSGNSFKSGLLAGVEAARKEAPLLLSQPQTLPETLDTYLSSVKPAQLFSVGMSTSYLENLSSEVTTRLKGLASTSLNVISDNDEFSLSISLANRKFPTLEPRVAIIVTNNDFADALTSGQFVLSQGGVMLFVKSNCIPNNIGSWITQRRGMALWVAGGPAAISNEAASGKQC